MACAFSSAICQIAPSPDLQAASPAEAPPQDSTTIRVNSSVVLVPTLVEKKDGSVFYGLTQKDFVVEDNGVPQKIHVDDDLDSQPVSIVVAVEKVV